MTTAPNDMSPLDNLQAQIMATTVLLQTLLQTLPRQTTRLVHTAYAATSEELQAHLQARDPALALALRTHTDLLVQALADMEATTQPGREPHLLN